MGPYLGVPRAPWVRQKNTSQKGPKTTKNATTSKFRKNEAISSNIFAYDHMDNLLTGELGNCGFWIDGPEIWPSQKGGGG